ncbi:MAG: exodeoxyribonuclease VII large subunit [Brevinematia bacterium]
MPDYKGDIFTVSSVAEYIYSLVNENIPPLWVRGEVSNLKFHQNGNIYFNIKDSSAKISAVIMSSSIARQNVETLLKEGLEIIVFGRITYYKKEGYITIFIDKVELLGEGLLKQKFEELKRKLEKEGLFDSSHKKKIPDFPECVGVITSPTGAAIRDILNVTRRRFSGVDIVLFPVSVQGENSAFEISKAIEIANKYFKGYLDVLIVGRGGGSIEDLWSFNEEVVARAIYNSEIPIISAVGHEIDYTIADYVADLRAPTPSAAAELVVKDKREILKHIENLEGKLNLLIESRIENIKKILQIRGREFLFNRIIEDIEQKKLFLDNLSIRNTNQLERYLSSVKNDLKLYTEKLKAFDPTSVLKRGFSITSYYSFPEAKWKILRSVNELQTIQEVKTQLSDGEFISKVKRP